MSDRFKFPLAGLAVAILLLALTGCGGSTATSPSAGDIAMDRLTLAAETNLPDYVHDAPPETREAYRFALANRKLLEQIPCYCGCNGLGHMNTYECYIDPDKNLAFDPHAAYCTICIDITRDAMAMSSQGKPVWEIRDYIDATYADAGPSTDTPPVEKPVN